LKKRLSLYAALLIGTLTIITGAAVSQPPTPQQQMEANQKIIQDLQQQLAAMKVNAQQPPAAQPLPKGPAPAPAAPLKAGINAKTGLPFPRGAVKSPRYVLQAAPTHRVSQAAPTQFAIVPKQLSMWYNGTYGDCVTAQEAFAKAAWSIQCGLPELFVPDAEVKRWASKYGFLNGANLTDVMDQMAKDGFNVGGVNYKDGKYSGVDYSNESVLQNAIFTGPVNIAIDANALPSGAGNNMGWYSLGGGNFPNTDHCVALCGYGPAEYLYQQLGLACPSALAGKKGYLLFTWNTIGFVSHEWIMGTVVEAWVRNPTTPGQTPPAPPATVAVPNVVGKTLKDAQAIIIAAGLNYAGPTPDATLAISESPPAGTQVATGSTVTVVGSVVPIPPVPGNITITLTQEQVQSVIEQAGAIVITPTTTIQEVLDKINRAKAKAATLPGPKPLVP
jgi:hypothetical protein